MRKLSFLLAVLFFLIVLAVYLNQDAGMRVNLSLGESSYMDDIKITQKKEGVVKWIANARRAVFLNDNDVKLADLKIMFPEKGLTLTSDGGMYDIERKNVEISGNISASTADYNIVAQKLLWDSSKNELVSDEKVTIVGKKFQVEGGRLEATSGKAKLSDNVRAVFSGK